MQSVCGQRSVDLIGRQPFANVGYGHEPDCKLAHRRHSGAYFRYWGKRVPDGPGRYYRADGGLVPHLRAN